MLVKKLSGIQLAFTSLALFPIIKSDLIDKMLYIILNTFIINTLKEKYCRKSFQIHNSQNGRPAIFKRVKIIYQIRNTKISPHAL